MAEDVHRFSPVPLSEDDRAVLRSQNEEVVHEQVRKPIADLECVIQAFDGDDDDEQFAVSYLQETMAETSQPPPGGVWQRREDAVEMLTRLKALQPK